ncbi:hypothetical protein [Nitrosomonas supralitoralis]|uniref:Uncharacterized protein n=1 Tax=Nitrosomonas supralitoralis TaxID=2116706 RepID=A0A2P7NSA3_9PROT|nr:hypothetical protein [Nitrosomonas supralitoralis]PSJ16346.1 hypothetical protein C7H79_13895 [Nitrosomonas supralitoralis]
MKNVQIIDKSFGQIIAEYPILDEFINETPVQEFIDDVWGIAFEEGLVDENYRENYDLEIVGDIQSQ